MAEDPRINEPSKTSNQRLFDKSVLISVRNERMKSGEFSKIKRKLNQELFPDIVGVVTAGLMKVKKRDSTKQKIASMRDTYDKVNELSKQNTKELIAEMEGNIDSLYAVETTAQTAAINQVLPAVLPASLSANKLSASEIFRFGKIVARGRNVTQWFNEDVHSATVSKAVAELNQGLKDGESVQQMTRRLTGSGGVFGSTERAAQTAVRTILNEASNTAREETYKKNSHLVKGVQYVATLDSVTTFICGNLDGKVFNINEGPRPSQHFQCRSTTTAVLKSWREMGLDIDDLPPSARRSLTGFATSKTKYPEWLQSISTTKEGRAIQNEVLGRRGAQLFRSGKLKFSQFADSKGRRLTVDKLEALAAA